MKKCHIKIIQKKIGSKYFLFDVDNKIIILTADCILKKRQPCKTGANFNEIEENGVDFDLDIPLGLNIFAIKNKYNILITDCENIIVEKQFKIPNEFFHYISENKNKILNYYKT